MPVHDWTRVEPGIFHDFHSAWITWIRTAFNAGLLPKGYYAMAEQHVGASIADILTLHGERDAKYGVFTPPGGEGGIAVAETPPQVRRRETVSGRRKTLAIRHVSGHRLIAMLEIVSPGNKDRPRSVEMFFDKAHAALQAGIHLMIIDLFPPGPHDPRGIHNAFVESLAESAEIYDLPPDEPLTLASYVAGRDVEMWFEHFSLGKALRQMPLFLGVDRYINVPLEETYQSAYRGMPEFWRDVLKGK